MNMKYLSAVMLSASMIAACSANKGAKEMTQGIDVTNLDTTANPGTDFYQYACGGWMKKHPLTGEYSRFGSFDMLAENNREQLKGLIEDIAAKQNQTGSIEQKIGDLYNMAMDSTALDKEGKKPIEADMKRIADAGDSKELFALMTELGKKGVGEYFGVYIDADIKNSQMNLVQLYQGGLSLGEKEYYLDEDEATKNIREKYKQHIINMFKLWDNDETAAQNKMKAVLDIETRIAKVSKSATEQRDPEANYHKMTYDELKNEFPGIDWDNYFSILGLNGLQELSVSQIEPIKEVASIIASESLNNQKAYLQWKLMDAASPYLSDNFVQENFDFYGKVLSGKKEQSPRWKRAVGAVNSKLGEAVGEMYVKKYFPAAAKERMVKLVKNLQTALGERIQAQEWMSDSTKNVAIDKLNAFYVKVGYPDKFRSYAKLDIKKDSYWANIERANEFNWNYMVAKKYGKPVDRDEWYMTPQTVNAYYNPTTNEICFPAGILQYPFFDMNADDAFNYGAIGVVIGHEMTHGFDDQGSQFDKDGNLKNWWTAADKEMFQSRTKVMADFYSNINVLPDLKANGQLTLGENLADHGGLMVAYQAFKDAKADTLKTEGGFTPEQRFFLAYADVWAGNIRDEEIRVRTKSDPHALGRWRVNGALPHIDAWYEAFGITEKDSMFVPKDRRVAIW